MGLMLSGRSGLRDPSHKLVKAGSADSMPVYDSGFGFLGQGLGLGFRSLGVAVRRQGWYPVQGHVGVDTTSGTWVERQMQESAELHN